jgi:outer membrane protein OmpA-like peptidoglycan-associated protein
MLPSTIRAAWRRAAAAACLAAACAPAGADTSLGQLTCDRIPGTTRNFLITSKADVRCIFRGQGNAEQWYVGESGVAVGLDLKWTKSETINFAALSATREYTPEGAFLAGDYSGAKADAALGVGGGAAILIGGSDETTSLQPAIVPGQGVGLSLGVGYLTLTPDPLNVARIATLRGDVFSQALYSAYFEVALDDYRAGRYEASDQFADKALAAAGGTRIAANRVEGSDLATDDLVTLTAARERVVAAQEHRFAATAPAQAAAVQASYDCWMRASLAPAAPERAAECREYFETRMAALEQHLEGQDEAARTVERMMRPRWWNVYFDTDVSELGEAGAAVVGEILAAFEEFKAARVYVWGHTDRAGSAQYNLELSRERATNVRDALIAGGVPADWIRTVGYGKTRPVGVSTNPHDATNRRVNIVVEPLNVTLN